MLLLDEPTNDLDVDTLRALEEAILDFAGCVVVISHDRWFLDRIATHILAFEGDGEVTWFEGNFQDYEDDKKRRLGVAADQPHRHAVQEAGAGLGATARRDGPMPNGKICYVEIPATDADASARFYETVFDWKSRTRGDGAKAFDDSTGSVSGAFVLGRPAHTTVDVVTYVMVDDLDATLARVASAGGKIVQPRTLIGPSGDAYGFFADPAGNVFGLYQEPTQT